MSLTVLEFGYMSLVVLEFGYRYISLNLTNVLEYPWICLPYILRYGLKCPWIVLHVLEFDTIFLNSAICPWMCLKLAHDIRLFVLEFGYVTLNVQIWLHVPEHGLCPCTSFKTFLTFIVLLTLFCKRMFKIIRTEWQSFWWSQKLPVFL